MSIIKGLFFCLFAFLFSACSSAYNSDDDEDLQTMPVTNNPLLLPQGGQEAAIPGMPSGFNK